MTVLHDYFLLRNFKAFQRLLDAGTERGQSNTALSTSVGKSWTRASTFKGPLLDINTRDWLGRTVLHLACTDLDSLEYVKLLLRHPAINVNIPDTESHWTPLHRALYNGNIPAALLLLQRADIDKMVQDYEGYTAFDVYNSTIAGTKPTGKKIYCELYTWGTNKNAAIGVGDGSDRAFPDTIPIGRKDESEESEESGRISRFEPIRVRQIDMSRLHTGIVTSESKGNLRLCGFGSGGRLGPVQHTQFNFTPLQQFSYTIVSVALGQDHTLALTSSGEILSWGLNRFYQLGYVIETTVPGEGSARIQPTPRKIQGPLRKETIIGIAATKSASACWTQTDVFTWGTNNGQLGYDRTGEAQIQPRKATKVTSPVLDISMTEFAMACLLISNDVVCIWNDRSVKLQFPIHAFPPEIQPYQPPQAIKNAKIAKVVGCDETFAALSFNGELFTFFPPGTTDSAVASTTKDKSGFKPSRVWALRRKFSSVRDVALGSDGSLIICTVSGHVFTRTRTPVKAGQTSSTKQFKFQKVPYLQRIVKVCANSTGAFAALKEEYTPAPINISGNTLSEDLADVLPFVRWFKGFGIPRIIDPDDDSGEQQEEELESHLENDVQRLSDLLDFLEKHRSTESEVAPGTPQQHHAFGANVIIHLPNGHQVPAHGIILAARSSIFGQVLEGSITVKDNLWKIGIQRTKVEASQPHPKVHISVSGCHPLSILILLGFFYSDEILAVWDRRLSMGLVAKLAHSKVDTGQIRTELRALAEILDLLTLVPVLEKPVKHVPLPSLETALRKFYDAAQSNSLTPVQSPSAPDVILFLADREIRTHSIILRARSPFFASFFGEEDWTRKRWSEEGTIRIDMKHLSWRSMKFVLQYMCCGADAAMFDMLPGIQNVDDLMDFIFEVMAAANELLLDRLVLLCSTVILQHVNLYNACYVLSEASYLDTEDLTNRIQGYIAVNMESFLETGMLDEVPHLLIKRLSKFIKIAQADKSPISRSGYLVHQALARHADWLALQDIPGPIDDREIDPSIFHRQSSTSSPKKKKVRQGLASPTTSPVLQPTHPLHHRVSTDEIFHMDDGGPVSISEQPLEQPSFVTAKPSVRTTAPVWKATSVPKVDMKALMAEAASASMSKVGASPSTSSMTSQKSQQELRRAGPSTENVSGLAGGSAASSPLRPGPATRPRVTSGSGEAAPATQPPPPSTPSRRNVSSSAAQGGFPPLSTPQKPSAPKTPQKPSGQSIGPELGPVITPTRQPMASSSSSNSIRRASGKVWNQATSAIPSIKTTGMSFADIQQLEADLLAGGPKKEKRSIVDIQQEERDRQQEADFLAWWAAEERRIKSETEAAQREASRASKPGKGSRPKRGGKSDNPSRDQGQTSSRGGRKDKPSQDRDQGTASSRGEAGDADGGKGRQGAPRKPRKPKP